MVVFLERDLYNLESEDEPLVLAVLYRRHEKVNLLLANGIFVDTNFFWNQGRWGFLLNCSYDCGYEQWLPDDADLDRPWSRPLYSASGTTYTSIGDHEREH